MRKSSICRYRTLLVTSSQFYQIRWFKKKKNNNQISFFSHQTPCFWSKSKHILSFGMNESFNTTNSESQLTRSPLLADRSVSVSVTANSPGLNTGAQWEPRSETLHRCSPPPPPPHPHPGGAPQVRLLCLCVKVARPPASATPSQRLDLRRAALLPEQMINKSKCTKHCFHMAIGSFIASAPHQSRHCLLERRAL